MGDLMVLKGESNLVIRPSGTTFEANKHYRCVEVSDGFIIFGEFLPKDVVESLFEPLHDRLIKDFKKVGLIVNNKPISRSKFKKEIDVHVYGSGKNKVYKGFFGNKELSMIGFDCYFSGETKTNFLNGAFDDFVKIIDGDLTPIHCGAIERGDSGVPISYRSISFRKQYNPHNEDFNVYY